MGTQMYTCVHRCVQMCTRVYIEYTRVYAEYDETPLNLTVCQSIGTQDFEDQSFSYSFDFPKRLVLSSLILSKEGFPICFGIAMLFGFGLDW